MLKRMRIGLMVAAMAGPVMAGLTSGPRVASAEPVGPASVVLAPHRAIYDLSLDHSTPGSSVSDVSGRIVYEITGSPCEGYTQNMRFFSVTANQDGAAQQTDLRTSSWEDVPARKLRFSSSNFQNDNLTEQSRGQAVREGPQSMGKAELTRPAKKSVEIPATARFPVQHSMELIAAARAGRHVLTADLYDGSEDGSKIYATSTLIGYPIAPGATTALASFKDGAALDKIPSWPVSISYFSPGDRRKDELPLYEMSYRFHENGVTSGITIDYGEYAVKAELKDLTYLEAAKCEPAH